MHGTQPPTAVVHSTFRIERIYPSPPARVFAAFSQQDTKRRWFAEGEGWEVDQFSLDFRVSGLETSRFRATGGSPMGNDTIYLDIVPDARIVFTYTMTVGDTRISSSLVTVELTPYGDGTQLVYTEQGAFFVDADAAGREAGCRELLDQLGNELRQHA